MKVAISTDGNFVSPHFGRCPSFTILEIENCKLIKKEEIANPGHHPGFLPEFFSNMGVEVIVAGGMGTRALGLFSEKGIKTFMGVSGKIDEVVEKLLTGTLEGGESLCNRGLGKGYGLDKNECDHSKESHKDDMS